VVENSDDPIISCLSCALRAAERGNTFAGGHNAAAVICSAFFCREQKLGAYREVCDGLMMRIQRRFAKVRAANE